MIRGRRLTLLLATILVAAACETGVGASPSLDTIRVSSLATERSIPNTGITLSPPGSASAKVDAQAAFALCLSHVASCPDTSPTTAQLTLVSDTGSGLLNAKGKVDPLMDRTLAWALTWSNVECHSSGGPPVDPSARANEATSLSSCDVIAFVDAGSGAYFFTVTYEHP